MESRRQHGAADLSRPHLGPDERRSGAPHDEAHVFEPHHDQHVWLYREDPKGVLTPFNPPVTCEHDAKAMAALKAGAQAHASH